MIKTDYFATVIKYVNDEPVGIETGTFVQIAKAFDMWYYDDNTYYKLAKYVNVPYEYITEYHFGCACKKRGGLKISDGIYCNSYLNNQVKRYSTLWGEHENFELLVRFFLDYLITATKVKPEYFQEWINNFVSEREFKQVSNLNDYKNICGIYFLVLDNYCKCYIGQTSNIRKRVLQHWSTDNFRTHGIDLFRAKDTTRIYVLPCDPTKVDRMEFDFVDLLPIEYKLNQLDGGNNSYIDSEETMNRFFRKMEFSKQRDKLIEEYQEKMTNFFTSNITLNDLLKNN